MPRNALRLCVALLVGILLAGASSALADDPPVRIDGPESGEVVRGLVYVTGRAVGSDPERFASYQLLAGPGSDPEPSALHPVSPRVEQPRAGGFLAVWDTSTLEPGEYTLVLVVDDVDGNEMQAWVSVVVEAAPSRPAATPAPTVRPDTVPPENAPPDATQPPPSPEPPPTLSPYAPSYEPPREPTPTPYLPRPLPTPGGEPALAPIPTPVPVAPPVVPTQPPPIFPPAPPTPTLFGMP